MAANYVLLETIHLTSSTASVVLDNIPQTGYTDLKVVLSVRNASSGIGTVRMGFNGSTASNYNYRQLQANGGSTLTTSTGLSAASTANEIALTNGNTSTANTFTNSEIHIPNYTSSVAKSWSVDSVEEENATTAYTRITSGLWTLTNSISSITFTLDAGSFAQNSTFSIYGLAATGTTPAIAPKATGGNIVANDGTYWYHAFLSSGNFTPLQALTCDYLVIAGGGSGGSAYEGGGGGAGGLRSTVGTTGGGGSLESPLSLTAQSYSVVIGAGGTSVNPERNGIAGSNSTFATITSIGGGYGACGGNNEPGGNGGSGGGTARSLGAGSGTTGQGFAGGNGGGDVAGGGGGAGVAGYSHGPGGAGVAISTWASPTGTGVSNYYAGGGGGGNSGAGGAGGGGAGHPTAAASAVANTGSGGGGARTYSPGSSGNGGSGLVIVRYAMA
jgi:hypothetical protein